MLNGTRVILTKKVIITVKNSSKESQIEDITTIYLSTLVLLHFLDPVIPDISKSLRNIIKVSELFLGTDIRCFKDQIKKFSFNISIEKPEKLFTKLNEEELVIAYNKLKKK